MKSWEHLIETGMAKMMAADDAEVVLNRFAAKLKALDPGATDRLLTILKHRCKVVQFKKGAVIIDYGQKNPQLLFRESGVIRQYRRMKREKESRGWTSKAKDWIFSTLALKSPNGSEIKIVVEHPAVFVTLHWDDHQFLAGRLPSFLPLAMLIGDEHLEEVMRREEQHPRSNGMTLSGL